MQNIKCVVIGDDADNETSLLQSYVSNYFPPENVSAISGNYAVTTQIDGVPFTLNLFSTAGQEDYDRLRPLIYAQTDIFLVCFSVVSHTSYENVREKWVPEITHHREKIPFLLVGTHIDLRDDFNVIEKLKNICQEPITYEAGESLAKELNAVKYIECSALTQQGLKNVFDEVIQAALMDQNKKKKCTVL